MDIVEHARGYAAEKHSTQQRKYSDEPYIVHLQAVVGLLRDHGVDDEHVLAAAYPHDVVEDTPTSLEDIMGAFGHEVAQLVYWLTDAEKGNRKARMTLSAWRLGRAPWEAKLIKLADIIDNTRNIAEKRPGLRARHSAREARGPRGNGESRRRPADKPPTLRTRRSSGDGAARLITRVEIRNTCLFQGSAGSFLFGFCIAEQDLEMIDAALASLAFLDHPLEHVD